MQQTTKKKKSGVTFSNSFVFPACIAIFLYLWYRFATDSLLEKFLIIFIAATMLIPFTLNLIGMAFTYKIPKSKGSNTKKEAKPSTKPQTTTSKYRTKVINNPNYLALRETIRCSIKSRQLDRLGVMKLKAEVDYRLGDHIVNYSSFSFENDMQEIYTKIKSSALSDEDYLYLNSIALKLIRV